MKRTEDILITELINRCNLGEVTSKIETVSGGFMHRMYKVCTDKGTYAVKHLNSEIMKRPDAPGNYAKAEKLEKVLEKNDIPIVPALEIGGRKMQEVDGNFFYVFTWQEGHISDWNNITNQMCYRAGAILGKIHAIDISGIEDIAAIDRESREVASEDTYIDWKKYTDRARECDSEILSALEENLDLLETAEKEKNKAQKNLPDIICLSDEDMDPKNVMWYEDKSYEGKPHEEKPLVIDLECLDFGNPVSHVMQLALQWSGITTCSLDIEKMVSFFKGYLSEYDNHFRDYVDIVGIAYTWTEWLEYNIKRALGECIDEEERKTGISQVFSTIDRIRYIKDKMPYICRALETLG